MAVAYLQVMTHLTRVLSIGALALSTAAVAPTVAPLRAQGTPTAQSAAPRPEIYFRAPLDGDTVSTSVEVLFGLRNYGVAPAGVKMSNTGHFHVLIDAEAPAPGVVVPADAQHIHYGMGQIESRITLTPGTHTLRLVLADHEHRVISRDLVSVPIRVTVRR